MTSRAKTLLVFVIDACHLSQVQKYCFYPVAEALGLIHLHPTGDTEVKMDIMAEIQRELMFDGDYLTLIVLKIAKKHSRGKGDIVLHKPASVSY